GLEQTCPKRFDDGTISHRQLLVKKLKVLAIVEQVEELLVVAGTEQVGAQSGAAPHHLPELRFRPNQLKEDEVDNFRDVNARIEHVHGNGDMRRLRQIREGVNQALRVFRLERDDPSEFSPEMRVILVEAVHDEERVVIVLGKNDGFAKP